MLETALDEVEVQMRAADINELLSEEELEWTILDAFVRATFMGSSTLSGVALTSCG